MEETQKKPDIKEQVSFIQGAVKVLMNVKDAQIVHRAENADMLKAIGENLITFSALIKTGYITLNRGDFDELLAALVESKSLIRQWHGMGTIAGVEEAMWAVYDKSSPEMVKLNEVLTKFQKLAQELKEDEEPPSDNLFPNEGQKNIYTCERGHQTVTVDRVHGTTPFIIGCPVCEVAGNNVEAMSSMYRVSQSLVPTHEFYKPTEEEINDLKSDLSRHSFANLMDHVNQGGLLFRKIKEVSNG